MTTREINKPDGVEEVLGDPSLMAPDGPEEVALDNLTDFNDEVADIQAPNPFDDSAEPVDQPPPTPAWLSDVRQAYKDGVRLQGPPGSVAKKNVAVLIEGIDQVAQQDPNPNKVTIRAAKLFAKYVGVLCVRASLDHQPTIDDSQIIVKELAYQQSIWQEFSPKPLKQSSELDAKFLAKLALNFSNQQLPNSLAGFAASDYAGTTEIKFAVQNSANPEARLNEQSAEYSRLLEVFANDNYAGTTEIKFAVQNSANPEARLNEQSAEYSRLVEVFANDNYAGPSEIKHAVRNSTDPEARLRKQSAEYSRLVEVFANDNYAGPSEIKHAVRNSADPEARLRKQSAEYSRLLGVFANDDYAGPYEIKFAVLQSANPEARLNEQSAEYSRLLEVFANDDYAGPTEIKYAVRRSANPEAILNEQSAEYSRLLGVFANDDYAGTTEIKFAVRRSANPEAILNEKSRRHTEILGQYPRLSSGLIRYFVRITPNDELESRLDNILKAAESFATNNSCNINLAAWMVRAKDPQQALTKYLDFLNLSKPLRLDAEIGDSQRNRHEQVTTRDDTADNLAAKQQLAALITNANLQDHEVEALMLGIVDGDLAAAAQALKAPESEVGGRLDSLKVRLAAAAATI